MRPLILPQAVQPYYPILCFIYLPDFPSLNCDIQRQELSLVQLLHQIVFIQKHFMTE